MRRPSVLLGVVILGLGSAVWAQPAAPAQAPSKPEQLHISLAGVTLHSIVQFLSMYTGKPILLPDRFPGDAPVDVVSAEGAAVSAQEAMKIFTTVLRKTGYTMVERESYIEIVQAGKAAGLPVGAELAKGGLQAQAVRTLIISLQNADAQELSTVLAQLKSATGNIQVYPELNKLLITDYGVNLASMLALVEKLDAKGDQSVCETYKSQSSSAETLLALALAYVKNLRASADPAIKKRLDNFSIESNAATNSLVFFGYPNDIEKVRDYIARFDVQPEESAKRFHIYNVLNRDANELKKTLDSILSATRRKTEKGSAEATPDIIADEENNTLITIATASRYQEILPLLEELDRPKAQVEIEAALFEISTDKLMDIGVELNTIDPPGSNPRGFGGATFGLSSLTEAGKTPIPPVEGGLTAGIFKGSATRIAALIRASEKDEAISFIAAPRITTVDNKSATVKIAERREFLKSIVSPEGRTSEVTSGGFNEAGIELKINPHINGEGGVRLEIMTQIDQFLPSTTTQEGASLTNVVQRKAETEVCVPDGNTVVIGGLTRTTMVKTVRCVPILGHIPLLGFLFRRQVDEKEERNLCIFITPHIHTGPETMAAEAERRKQELKDIETKSKLRTSSE
ncbi:MAG: hypothetical protein J7M08_01305 [Planctomycetes bacterium]|nr:hypothetical protein [Planctomycetota bacterium]